MIFQRILNETEKIRWEVERVEKNLLMAKNFAEEVFQNEKEVCKRRYWKKSHYSFNNKHFYGNHQKNGNSCVFIGDSLEISDEDKKFIKITEYLDLIFRPLVGNSPYISFTYIISRRGVTRGYPWKDFSALPPNFRPTQQSFFYIASERHNPSREEKWTEPYLCPLTNTWMVTCSSPVWKNSEFIGVIGVDVNLGKIIEPLGRVLKTAKNGYAFIISSYGNLIISSDEGMDSLREDGIWVEGKWKDSKWRNKIFKGFSQRKPLLTDTQISEVKLTSGKRYLCHTFLETTGWSIVIILPRDIRGVPPKPVFMKEGKNGPSVKQYKADGIYLPLISFFVSSFSKSLRQMEKLIEGTKIIGRGVLDHRIEVHRKDEIGLIAHSINKMAKELKKGKEQLEAAYKKVSQLDRLMALGRLTAGVAHEINNPLGVISNYVQILLRNPTLSSEAKIDLKLIEEEILGMTGIIKGLLNFSRESQMGKNPINTNEVLRKTVSLLKFQLSSQSIKLVENYDDTLPLILGDANHLQQVFLNVMLNSIQSMPKGGKLGIKSTLLGGGQSRGSNGWVSVEISDTGIGIESKYLDKIFDPFFTTRGWGAGTGLGLSISYGIIKEHGGNIDVKSRSGEGTLVRTSLPIAKDS